MGRDVLCHLLEQPLHVALQGQLPSVRPAAAQVLLQKQPEALRDLGHVHLRFEAPEEGVPHQMRRAEGAAQQEAGEGRVVTGLILEHLHELQDVGGELRVGHVLEAGDGVRADARVGKLGVEELERGDGPGGRPPWEQLPHLEHLGGGGPGDALEELGQRLRGGEDEVAVAPEEVLVVGGELLEGVHLRDHLEAGDHLPRGGGGGGGGGG